MRGRHVRVVACMSTCVCLCMSAAACVHLSLHAFMHGHVCVCVCAALWVGVVGIAELFIAAASPSCWRRVYEKPRGIMGVPADRDVPYNVMSQVTPLLPRCLPLFFLLKGPPNMSSDSLSAVGATARVLPAKLKIMPSLEKADCQSARLRK